jgi:hypothetical protein
LGAGDPAPLLLEQTMPLDEDFAFIPVGRLRFIIEILAEERATLDVDDPRRVKLAKSIADIQFEIDRREKHAS